MDEFLQASDKITGFYKNRFLCMVTMVAVVGLYVFFILNPDEEGLDSSVVWGAAAMMLMFYIMISVIVGTIHMISKYGFIKALLALIGGLIAVAFIFTFAFEGIFFVIISIVAWPIMIMTFTGLTRCVLGKRQI